MTPRTPSYRLHKPSGQAVVTFGGRDFYLGRHGTPESRAEYDRLLAEWLAAGRGRPAAPESAPDPSVNEVLVAFLRHARGHYPSAEAHQSCELDNLKVALRPLRELYGHTSARAFGPLALRAVRDHMVKAGLARTTINARVNRIRRVFRWAAGVELVPSGIFQALRAVDGLRQGRTQAKETEAVRPVPIEHVEAALPSMPRPVAAMVRLQLLTGCRLGEVIVMRGCDLTPGEPTWEYRPQSHKNAWRGQTRVIPLGPKAQEIVREFLKPDLAAHLFSPRDAVEEMHARRARGRKSRPTPSELARRRPEGSDSSRRTFYDRRGYRQAVVRACRRAGVPAWSPLQLRHATATAIRARYGLEAASIILGHAKPETTLIYAEKDIARAHSIMAEIG